MKMADTDESSSDNGSNACDTSTNSSDDIDGDEFKPVKGILEADVDIDADITEKELIESGVVRSITEKELIESGVVSLEAIEATGSDTDDEITKAGNFMCEICKKSFSAKYNLDVHKKKKRFLCDICEQIFCMKGALMVHRKIEHSKINFKCDSCGTEFETKFNLSRHLKTKSVNKCDQCDITLCNPVALTRHVYDVHTLKVCAMCGKKYEYIYEHMRKVHEGQE